MPVAFQKHEPSLSPWRKRMHEVIFEADTPSGKAFDVLLLAAILLSVLVVMLESVVGIRRDHGGLLQSAEWLFTGLFTVEYGLRLLCVRSPWRYARSFFGVVDLLAILPTYVSLLLPGSQTLIVIRALRLLRVFRIFKLAQFLSEATALRRALWESRAKMTVFLTTVLTIVVIMGAAMHLVEGPENGFTSVPQSVYWAIVTITTVGYGDISPQTPLGKVLATLMMIVGYSLIVVPTGIITAELAQQEHHTPITTQSCPSCMREGHAPDAVYCRHCGRKL